MRDPQRNSLGARIRRNVRLSEEEEKYFQLEEKWKLKSTGLAFKVEEEGIEGGIAICKVFGSGDNGVHPFSNEHDVSLLSCNDDIFILDTRFDLNDEDSKYQKPPFITFGCKVADGYGTHPARCIPELMRILMDVKAISWKASKVANGALDKTLTGWSWTSSSYAGDDTISLWRRGNAEQITELAISAGHP
ncbi:alpha-1,4 glucan phosphorylase L isozyme, chloroplastic/amyloplastic isoform X2 [Tanacetum coccineum]